MPPKSISNRKTPKLSKLLPERKARILGDRPTMAFEDDEDFDVIHAEMIIAYSPQGTLEDLLVKDIADAQWQILRLREMLSASVDVKLPAAAHNLLGSEYVLKTGWNWPMARESLTRMVRKALMGNTSELQLLEALLERAGVSHRHLKTEAFGLCLPTISILSDLISKTERRRDQAIKRLEDRRKYQAAMSRLVKETSGNVIDVPTSIVPADGIPAEEKRAEDETPETEESS